jgi:hypothetical protein
VSVSRPATFVYLIIQQSLGWECLKNSEKSSPPIERRPIREKGMTTTETRERVWRSWLESELAICYWEELANRYRRYDKAATVLVAITSCAAVAGLSLWSRYPWAWQTLCAISGATAIVQLIVHWPEQVQDIATLQGEWIQIGAEYRSLWDSLHRMTETEALEIMERLQIRETEISKRETRLPCDIHVLREKCTQKMIELANNQGRSYK